MSLSIAEKEKMKTGSIIIIVLVIALIGLFAYSSLRTTGNSVKTGEDVFEGRITNFNIKPETLDGTGVYDRSCNPVESGLTQCDAGIQTEKGLLNFNYKHNMHMQRCIDSGDKLKVEILEGGKAKVTRY